MLVVRKLGFLFALGLASFIFAAEANSQGKYDPGANDREIKIGNIMPYSGPVSAYGVIAKAIGAYFDMINEKGGINGRRINFISYDDAYSPPKTVEQARRLVEDDEVLFIAFALGTAGNTAIQKYMNQRKVPQLFVASGASKFGNPRAFPWTMGWQATYRSEGRVYATYILNNMPNKKIGILFQNDDLGKDYLQGLKDVLGEKYSSLVVSEMPYETSSPTIDSQVVAIKAAAPDIFINIATPKFAAQAIRKIGELQWHPVQFLANVGASVGATLKPAGAENSKGILSAHYRKDPTDVQWDNDPAMNDWRSFMSKYMPNVDKTDDSPLGGYGVAFGIVRVLEQAGNDLTRANIMRQAANLDMEIGIFLPGVRIKTSESDFLPIEQLQMMKFTGEKWELFGSIIDVSESK